MILIADGMVIRNFGSQDLNYLLDKYLEGLTIGPHYRFLSKGAILKIEVMCPSLVIAVFTNLDNQRHPWVIRMVLDKMQQNMITDESDDNTELEQ